MLICTKCKETFEEINLPQKLRYDEFGNTYLVDDYCPSCGKGILVEAELCPVCGQPFESDNFEGVCNDCLEEHETLEVALKIGDVNREPVEINGFIATALSADRICHILEEAVKGMIKDRDDAVIEYLRDDLPYFTEWVEKHADEGE